MRLTSLALAVHECETLACYIMKKYGSLQAQQEENELLWFTGFDLIGPYYPIDGIYVGM